MRVILDANIYVSALLKPSGRQAKIVQKGFDGVFQIVLSENIFLEIGRVLNYRKIVDRLPFTQDQVKQFLEHLVEMASWTNDEVKVTGCRDPRDDIYLSCAKESQAKFLVSGDQDLLQLKRFEETIILNSKEFMEHLLTNTP